MRGPTYRGKARLDGKVIIITGANTGIGKETAKDLVKRGAKVYIGCRSLQRANQAIRDIQKETGVIGDKLSVILLDLASLKSVREFVKEFKTKETRLDILINNAGVAWSSQKKTVDGFETIFGVNHLGHFLLTHLLMDSLTSVPKSRIVNVSAKAHQQGTINFDDIMLEKNFSVLRAYCQSKLANILFTRELAKRLKGTGVSTYSLHPGVIETELLRDMPFVNSFIVRNLLRPVKWLLFKNLKDGAQTTVYCAVDERLDNESGKFYSDCREVRPNSEAQDDAVAKRLWDMSVQFVKLDPSDIHPKLKH